MPVPVQGQELKLREKVLFDFASNQLSDETLKGLQEVYYVMDKYPDVIVEVGGHTDSVGSDKYNLILGEKRAKIIAQQLIYQGVANERLVVRSYGEENPENTNDTPEGRRLNRRITFKVLSGGK